MHVTAKAIEPGIQLKKGEVGWAEKKATFEKKNRKIKGSENGKGGIKRNKKKEKRYSECQER